MIGSSTSAGTSVSVLVQALMVMAGCSCGTRDDDTSFRAPARPSIVRSVGREMLENGDTMGHNLYRRMIGEIDFESSGSEPFIRADSMPTDSIKPRGTTKMTKARETGVRKQPVPVQAGKDRNESNPDIGLPLTREAAMRYAYDHWKLAAEYQTIDFDSAYEHCRKGLSIYENGSLFSLNAQLLIKARKYSAASQAAERSIARNDHWNPNDLLIAHRTRCIAYDALNRMYPSQEACARAKKANEEMELIQKGRVR